MKASELIGKKAIRTAPTTKVGDCSYSREPIFIVGVTDTHIVYEHVDDKLFGGKRYVLNWEWMDDNWADYAELGKLKEAQVTKPPTLEEAFKALEEMYKGWPKYMVASIRMVDDEDAPWQVNVWGEDAEGKDLAQTIFDAISLAKKPNAV